MLKGDIIIKNLIQKLNLIEQDIIPYGDEIAKIKNKQHKKKILLK